ncbi:MAG: class II aldolase/adducin family protein [Gammaproteobacteria bacterium]|nr:class II aldolase/adducin family protein [Gammaproteobacteria bacterium]
MSAVLNQVPPHPDHMSPEEWATRCDLAACYRLVDAYGWSDFFGTHISVRVPGTDHFLLNPFGMLFDEITASALVKVDQDGNLLSESEYPINPAGFTIHSAVHMASHTFNAVLHTHTRAGNAVACMKEGLLPNNQKALTLLGFVAYHDYESVALNHEERERIVNDLGDKRVLVLRNHGLLTVGETIGEAFLWMARMEVACQYQVDILSCGREIQELSPQTQQTVIDQALKLFGGKGPVKYDVQWDAMLRKLERESATDWRI